MNTSQNLLNRLLNNSLIRFIFFGNFFYGACVIALSVESSLQQKIPLNTFWFYLIQFMLSVFYYNLAFSKIDEASSAENIRAAWHFKHRKIIQATTVSFLILSIFLAVFLIWPYLQFIPKLHSSQLALIVFFPLFAIFYYGLNRRNSSGFNLRKIGWLKPFLIGFTWAGAVGILPQTLYSLRHGLTYDPGLISLLLFLKNFMFVSVLAIMFDIKDYARDYNYEIKTFVVRFGLRKTLFFILVPMLLLGLAAFITFALIQGFHPIKIALNCLPFLLCLLVAMELKQRKSILFYLLAIDGLMLVKGLCGSLAMLYF